MKKLLSLSFALLLTCATAFAQGSGSSGGGKNDNLTGLAKVAQAMTTQLCDCFNKHALSQLSPTVKKAVEKMAKKGVDDPDQLAQTLTPEELESVAKELSSFSLEGTEFDNCTENAEGNLAQYETDLMQAMMEAGGDEEKFQENFQNAMIDVMKREKKVCGTFYYFFLIGMKQGGK